MSDWKETTLGEVGKVVTGKTPSKDNPEHWGGLLGFITPSDIKDDSKYIHQTERSISQEGLEAFKRIVIPSKSVIVTCIGSDMGKVIMNSQDCITNQQINSLIVNRSEYDKDFVYYRLKNSYFLLWMHADGGSTMPILNKSTFEGLTFSFPPLPEQQAIASVLSSLDDKIELLRKQNKTLENIAQTLFKEWFVKGKNWDGKLSQYLKVQGGYAFKGEDFKERGFAGIIKITNITMGVVDILNTQFVNEDIVADIDADKFRIRGGDFLIAMTGAEIGKIGIVENTKKQIWLNQRVGKLIAKVPYGELIGYLALRSRAGQEHITDAASGSAQANISSTGIEEMVFVPYSEKETNSFGKTVKPIFKKITFNLSQIQTLSKLRDALLPKLMKGEIRVKREKV